MHLLSIVIPVYGVERWIERCLRSIVDLPDFERCCELIIVDDGSPDGSIEIVQRVCAGFTNFHLVRQVNQGLGAARNAGAALAKGRFLWFIDSDDWLTNDGLVRVLEVLQYYPDMEVLNIDYIMSNGHRSSVVNNSNPKLVYQGIDYLSSSIVQNPVQYYVWSLSYFRKHDLQFEKGLYHEDTLFTPTALFHAQHIRRLDVVCYVYNLREGSIMSSGNSLKHATDMITIVDRLEAFRRTQRHGKVVLASYSALAVGGIYFYWKQLNSSERYLVAQRLKARHLIRPIIRSGRWKFLIAIARMSIGLHNPFSK